MWVRSFQPSNSDSVTSSIICSFVPHICWPFKHLTRVKGPDFAPSADRNLPKNSGGTERKRDQDVLYVRKPEAERIPAIACFYVNCQQSGGKHPYRPPPNTPPTPLLLLKHGMFSPTDHCAELSPHPCDPPIGSFHSATMAARGRVIWGTKEPSQPPAPGTMDTPTDTFFSSPF